MDSHALLLSLLQAHTMGRPVVLECRRASVKKGSLCVWRTSVARKETLHVLACLLDTAPCPLQEPVLPGYTGYPRSDL